MFLGFITSHRFEKKVSILDVEIKNLKLKLERLRGRDRTMDEVESKQVAELERHLKQKELEKHHLEEGFEANLAAVLDRINGKARAWTVCPDLLVGLANETEELLKTSGVKVKNRPGAEAEFRPAGQVSRSQYGKRITTRVVIRRVHDGWRLVHAERDHCYVNQSELREITLRPAAYEDIIRYATRNFQVWDEDLPNEPPGVAIA